MSNDEQQTEVGRLEEEEERFIKPHKFDGGLGLTEVK